MIIDLHIHSKASDGKLTVQEIFKEAKTRNIGFMAITDHDSIGCQSQAIAYAKKEGNQVHHGNRVKRDLYSPKVS